MSEEHGKIVKVNFCVGGDVNNTEVNKGGFHLAVSYGDLIYIFFIIKHVNFCVKDVAYV